RATSPLVPRPPSSTEPGTKTCASLGYGREMDEARAVLARLDRIVALEREQAPAGVLLDEVRALLTEAEAWVRIEPAGTDAAADALDRCRTALTGLEVLGRKSRA